MIVLSYFYRESVWLLRFVSAQLCERLRSLGLWGRSKEKYEVSITSFTIPSRTRLPPLRLQIGTPCWSSHSVCALIMALGSEWTPSHCRPYALDSNAYMFLSCMLIDIRAILLVMYIRLGIRANSQELEPVTLACWFLIKINIFLEFL